MKFIIKMDPEYENEPFMGINFKRSVAKKFKTFARQNGGSYSVVLDQMLWFFERHKLSPEDELPNHLIKTEKKLLQRINAVIAIIKEIEKRQTLPTVGMLQALFEAEEPESKKPTRTIEKRFENRTLEEELEKLKKSL